MIRIPGTYAREPNFTVYEFVRILFVRFQLHISCFCKMRNKLVETHKQRCHGGTYSMQIVLRKYKHGGRKKQGLGGT